MESYRNDTNIGYELGKNEWGWIVITWWDEKEERHQMRYDDFENAYRQLDIILKNKLFVAYS
jgi:hypothetical protein